MRLPPLVHNRVSYAGAAIALLALAAMVFLFVLSSLAGDGEAPYAGLVTFILLPAFLLFGLVLIPIGMLRERRYLRRTGAYSIPRFPVVDLNIPQERNAATIFVVGSIMLVSMTVFGSFQAYEATESVAFCGSTCHTVMEPEKVAHRRSPHARVRCVECHVGPGTQWYIRSKLTGAHQLWSVATDSYPRPIPVPIESLRPARETCEHCHWPGQHADVQRLKTRVAFLPDEANTRWEIDLLVNVGGGDRDEQTAGIHWHLNPSNRVEYIPADASRQKIPWVRVTDRRTGTATEYNSTEEPLSAEQIAAGPVRVMDCLDCHNRPSHRFETPEAAVDQAILAGGIDPSLPGIKAAATELLKPEYASVAEAEAAIDKGLRDHYAENEPTVLSQREPTLVQAATALKAAYRTNFFPAMKARWSAYPNNAGHFNFPGCVRCHDGLHQDAAGESIASGCTTCHVITAQGKAGALKRANKPEGLSFEHPPIKDLEDAWQDTPCTDCHAESGDS
ncbi:MAG TPA: NapC/NirT family cytochrome c [Candidatus Dormibacteraeota bacterium]|nr:NapC/NirT family cytochrome c [Candidatus Dormibacteraeota bacterium]